MSTRRKGKKEGGDDDGFGGSGGESGLLDTHTLNNSEDSNEDPNKHRQGMASSLSF